MRSQPEPWRRLWAVVAAAAALGLLSGCTAQEDPAPPTTAPGRVDLPVKVMTFNIRYASLGDGRNAWPLRRKLVAEVIREFGGDFVGLQEVLPGQLAFLRGALAEYDAFGRSREALPLVGEAGPILYRPARWQADPKQRGTFWLSDTPEAAGSRTWGNVCPRIVTWGRFVDKETGRALYVYNTHFSHMSVPAREKSAALLVARIAARQSGEPFVVTGDLNAAEDSPCVLRMKGDSGGAKMIDTFRALHPDTDEVKTFCGFTGGTRGRKIDYVFAPPSVKVLAAKIVRTNRDGRYPSDHYPVTAELVFRRDPGNAASP